ncbi:MAG TPA: ATP-grasp domain-containing protein [Longimicrobiales bacterium]
MKLVLLHTPDALGPPEDPVLAQVEGALREGGHATARVSAANAVQPIAEALRREAPDLVFNLAESFAGKSALESNVAALLNLLDLRYTGSSPAGLLLAGDKSVAKKILAFHGIPTPEFATVHRGAVDWAGELSFPLIIKPTQEDASLGVSTRSVVKDVRELLETIERMRDEFGQPALVEEFIDGREFYVGVLGNEQPRALPVMELDFTGFPEDTPRIASFAAKWGEDGAGSGQEYAGTRSIFPQSLEPELEQRMQKLAVQAFQALRLRDYGRIDMRVKESGDIYILEVNPNCYLEQGGEFARAAARSGLTHPDLVRGIVELASARYAH